MKPACDADDCCESFPRYESPECLDPGLHPDARFLSRVVSILLRGTNGINSATRDKALEIADRRANWLPKPPVDCPEMVTYSQHERDVKEFHAQEIKRHNGDLT